jgi:hypothetical protein
VYEWNIVFHYREVRGYHGSEDVNVCHLGCNAVWTWGRPMFRINIVSPSSGIRWREDISPKSWHLSARLHGVTTRLTNNDIIHFSIKLAGFSMRFPDQNFVYISWNWSFRIARNSIGLCHLRKVYFICITLTQTWTYVRKNCKSKVINDFRSSKETRFIVHLPIYRLLSDPLIYGRRDLQSCITTVELWAIQTRVTEVLDDKGEYSTHYGINSSVTESMHIQICQASSDVHTCLEDLTMLCQLHTLIINDNFEKSWPILS